MTSPAETPRPDDQEKPIGLGLLRCNYNGKVRDLKLVAGSVHQIDGFGGRRQRIMFVSAVGSSKATEGLAAMLRSRGDHEPSFQLVGDSMVPWKHEGVLRDPGFSYEVETFRLSKDLVHVVGTTTRKGFMASFSNRAIWNCLSSDAFTTPVLRTWVQPLAAEFMERKILVKCASYQCQGCFLDLRPAMLDRIVCDMVKAKKLMLRE